VFLAQGKKVERRAVPGLRRACGLPVRLYARAVQAVHKGNTAGTAPESCVLSCIGSNLQTGHSVELRCILAGVCWGGVVGSRHTAQCNVDDEALSTAMNQEPRA
jgi:hypothetical protein